MNEITETIYQDVKNEYLQQVVVPEQKPTKQFLLCPIGLVGAGKTTVVRPLAEKLSLVRISGNEIRKLFKESGFGYEKVYDLTFELIQEFISRGYSICIDSDCAGKIKQIEEIANKNNLQIVWIHINPPEEFIIQKLSNLTPNWLGTAQEMVENYRERKSLHKDFDLDFTVIFDTSQPDIQNQIENSVSMVEQKVGI
ncbi:MAG TPA: AAA family ATPase [Candidatus Paceibacterota bacterium]|nr:AAA family ATPase [Candidatus Paceibacterota bacterium]HMO82830.1 AAA family ATPase [Candidatus Paceibacterota bacterium]